MEALSSYFVGVWSVQTVTGTTYLLDLDNMLVVRQWDLSANNDNILRRDGDPISLVRLQHCEVGDPCFFCSTFMSRRLISLPRFRPRCFVSNGSMPGSRSCSR